MDSVIWVPIALSLAVYFVPAALFRRQRYQLSRDYLVSTRGASDGVFQNSSLAYAIQLATFGPFFVWGLTGDWIPGVWNSLFYCLGLSLLYVFRGQISDFLREALAKDRSVTIHEFLARSHGSSPLIRLVASGLTVVALMGIVLAEMFGILSALGPLLGFGSEGSYIFVVCLFLLMFLYSTIGGNDGVMRTDQLQLGLAYIGVFVATIGMIVLLMPGSATSAARPVIPIVFFGVFGALWLLVRRFRFIAITEKTSVKDETGLQTVPLWRAYELVERGVNILVVATVIVLVFAAAAFTIALGPRSLLDAVRQSASATTGMSGLALFAIALLPLGYQIVDITNWQRFAAAGDPANYSNGPGRRALLQYVLEAPLVWIALLAFGAIAGGLFNTLAESQNAFGDFALRLASLGSLAGSIAATAFLVAVFAIGLSTMDAVFSATLCAFQYDLLPALERPEINEAVTARKIRMAQVFSLAACAIVIVLLYVVEKYLAFGRDNYLALLLAFYSAQMAFVPLVAGAFVSARRLGGQSPVAPAFAAGALIAGAAVGIAATVGAIIWGGGELLLWGAIPGCLLVSSAIYILGWHLGNRGAKTIELIR